MKKSVYSRIHNDLNMEQRTFDITIVINKEEIHLLELKKMN